MSVPAAAHVVAWLALGGGVAFVAVKQADLARRLERAETAGDASGGASDAERGAEVKALAQRLDAIEQKQGVKSLEARSASNEVKKVSADVARIWAELLKAPGEAAKGGGELEGEVRKILDRYVMERQFREKLGKAAGPAVPKKPDFPVLAKALNLRPDQAERFAQDIRGIQMELFQVLQVPRADGVVPLEEIKQAEQFPEGSPQRTGPFLKLVKLKIPDTDETYFERAVALASGVKERTGEYFDKDQVDVLNGIDLDWFGIKFPN
jgi:hypothetical protein